MKSKRNPSDCFPAKRSVNLTGWKPAVLLTNCCVTRRATETAIAKQPTPGGRMIAILPEKEVDHEPDSVIKVSPSRLSLWHQCRLKYYFRYIARLEKPMAATLLVGRVVHEILEHWNRQRWLEEAWDMLDLADRVKQ